MKRSSLILIDVLVLTLVATEVASAHPRACVIFRPVMLQRSFVSSPMCYSGGSYGVRPSYLSSNWAWNPGYYSYNSGYNYSQPAYYGGQAVVVVSQPKPRPNLPIVSWDENKLEELALNKFVFARGLDTKTNQIRLQIVARDYHSDTGALKKVKFQVRWIIFKHLKDHDEEVEKHDTCKLKFDPYGRFTDFSD